MSKEHINILKWLLSCWIMRTTQNRIVWIVSATTEVLPPVCNSKKQKKHLVYIESWKVEKLRVPMPNHISGRTYSINGKMLVHIYKTKRGDHK